MAAQKVGRGTEDGVTVGPLIDAKQRDKVAELVDDATSRGASVVTGGSTTGEKGYFFEPTVLTDVAPDADLFREEIFGPVAPDHHLLRGREGGRDGQRHRVRPGRLRLHHRPRPDDPRQRGPGVRHGRHQPGHRLQPRGALRRRQALRLRSFAYVRIMQALGAYGFRGLYERKTHFLQSVPYALANVQWLLNNVELPMKLPELMKAMRLMASSDTLQSVKEPERLTVRVSSFSFHRGVPQDNSGHGGGFVFDARGLPNPGREERFKSLTGRDAPVIEYLDRYDSVHQYLAHVVALVDGSIANYKERGFKHLSVAFGCTGGQHRSVFLAEALAKHLREQDGIDVVLRHRELENFS